MRVCPDGSDCVITQRVGGQLEKLSWTFLRLLGKQGDSTSRKSALDDSGQTWTVNSSLTSVDFRVLVNMSNGDHRGVKWSFTQFKS